MKDEIICAGYGGQGVVLAGSLLVNAALKQGLETCGMVSYGVEMRGGTANATAIISDRPIGSPVVINPTTLIIMNDQSFQKFEDKLHKDSLLILNTSECKKRPTRKDIILVEIEATKLAEKLGNKKVANVILVGIYLKKKKIIDLQSAIDVLPKVLKGKDDLIEINKKALELGYGDS